MFRSRDRSKCTQHTRHASSYRHRLRPYTIPLYLPHGNPALSLVLSSFPPIHLIESHLAQPSASLAFLAPALFLAVTAACAAFRGVCRGRGVDIFAVDVLRFRDECAAAVASAGVSLLQAEELDLLGDEVEDVHHCGRRGGCAGCGERVRGRTGLSIRLRSGVAQFGLRVRGKGSIEVFSCSS